MRRAAAAPRSGRGGEAPATRIAHAAEPMGALHAAAATATYRTARLAGAGAGPAASLLRQRPAAISDRRPRSHFPGTELSAPVLQRTGAVSRACSAAAPAVNVPVAALPMRSSLRQPVPSRCRQQEQQRCGKRLEPVHAAADLGGACVDACVEAWPCMRTWLHPSVALQAHMHAHGHGAACGHACVRTWHRMHGCINAWVHARGCMHGWCTGRCARNANHGRVFAHACTPCKMRAYKVHWSTVQTWRAYTARRRRSMAQSLAVPSFCYWLHSCRSP
eukprot:349653-Chlamydomonas_euryale.AAC.1